MTNIDTQIIFDKNGNPIPQYLDVADKTGGSAGTMKPITKNSYPEIQDVNVTNQQALPTDYPDSAVKQELELIKAQQQQILDRLDEPVPTQLTGSNDAKIVLIDVLRNINVPTGATVRIMQGTEVAEFDSMFIHFMPGGSSTYGIYCYPYRLDDNVPLNYFVVYENTSGAINRNIDRFEVSSLKMELGIRNDGDTDHIFNSIALFGVRS